MLSYINVKDNTNKFDWLTFFKIFKYSAFELYKEENNQTALKAYLYTEDYLQKLTNKSIARLSFVSNFLINLDKAVNI